MSCLLKKKWKEVGDVIEAIDSLEDKVMVVEPLAIVVMKATNGGRGTPRFNMASSACVEIS